MPDQPLVRPKHGMQSFEAARAVVADIYVSVKTVETYRARIAQKIEIHN
jgi:DNA-binding NarL/FixJ family response regulator